MPIQEDVLLTNEPYQITPDEAEARARRAYDISLREKLPIGFIQKNMELYDNGAYRQKIDEWKNRIANAPDEERNKMMLMAEVGNLFNITSYMSRKGWLFTEENRGNTSAFFDAMQEYHAESKRPTINVMGREVRLPHPSYIAGSVVKTLTEFEAIPIGSEKAATWVSGMAQTAGKFGAQAALQAPTAQESAMPTGEFIKQRTTEAAKSAITGAGVSILGKYIPNPLYRIPLATGGFMSLTALEGGSAEDVLTTGVQILGFEALGLAQQARKGKTEMKKAVEAAREKEPKLKDVSDAEVVKIYETLVDISEQKGTANGLQEKGQKEIKSTKTGAESTTAPKPLSREEFDNPKMPESSLEPPPPVSRTYYHGTNADNLKISDLKSESTGTVTHTLGESKVKRYGIFLSESKDFAQEYGKNIMPLKVKTKNPADVSFERQNFIDSLDAIGKDRDIWMEAKHAVKYDWEMFDGELGRRFVEYLKSKGYDSAYFSETLEVGKFSGQESREVTGDTLVVFDNKDLSTGNYDEYIKQFKSSAPVANAQENAPNVEMPVGTGEVKKSRLSERVVDKLSKTSKELKDALGEADEYKTTSFSEQAALIEALKAKDFERLVKVATNEAKPPKGFENLLPNAAYIDLVKLADATNNVDLALRLKNSNISLANTRRGQEIVMLRDLDETSSASVMGKVEKAKEKAIDTKLKKQGKSIKSEKQRMSTEMKEKVKEVPLKLDRLKKFIEDIRCA